MRPGSLAAAERKESIRPRSRAALNAVRQLSAKLNSPAATMQDAPNQSVHCTMAAKPAPTMTPFVWRTGTTTAQHNVPETNMVAQTRIPVMAPAATNMKSQEKTTVRPDQLTAEEPLLQARQKGPARKAFEARADRRQPLRPDLVDRGNEPG